MLLLLWKVEQLAAAVLKELLVEVVRDLLVAPFNNVGGTRLLLRLNSFLVGLRLKGEKTTLVRFKWARARDDTSSFASDAFVQPGTCEPTQLTAVSTRPTKKENDNIS